MTLYRTSGPDVEPVTLTDAKTQLKIDHASEDALIGGLIRAAREEVEAQTGAALIDQTWRLALDDWPAHDTIRLMRHPVRELISVTVYGSEGEASLVPPAACHLDALSRPARLMVETRPSPEQAMNGVEIDFRAGYGESGTDVPDTLKRAMLMLVAHWYEFRAAFGAAEQPVSIPAGFDRLIAPHRLARL